MELVFATADVHPRDRLEYWREVACRAFVDLECRPLRRRTFRASIRSGAFADLGISLVASDPCAVLRTRRGIARSRDDVLLLSVQLAGSAVVAQDSREARLGAGDFALYDTQRPYELSVHAGTAQLVLKIPRKALEARLGSSAMYTARRIAAADPLGGLVSAFLSGLPSRAGALEALCERRIAEQALDLVALACTQGTGSEMPRYSSAAAVALTHLKATIESRLWDHRLTPTRAAAAAGVSVRYANQLLAADATSLERFIVERRLHRCAAALADAAQAHRTIADIAHAWGFSSASHFAHRFKERYGETARQYRGRTLGERPEG